VTLIVIIGSFISYFLLHEVDNWNGLYISGGVVLTFGGWQIYLYTRLLSLADKAKQDMEQFHGFTVGHPSLLEYLIKGAVYLVLWGISFIYNIRADDTEEIMIHDHQNYNQIPGLIFGCVSLLLLMPIYRISISPSYTDRLHRKGRKYLITFHIVCLMSFAFIIQRFIFIATHFEDIYQYPTPSPTVSISFMTTTMTSPSSMTEPSELAYSLSFSSIGFLLWLFGKYAGVLYPAPVHFGKYKNRNNHNVEMSPVHSRKTTRKSLKERDRNDDSFLSKMTMGDLYNNHPDLSQNDTSDSITVSGYQPPQRSLPPLPDKDRMFDIVIGGGL